MIMGSHDHHGHHAPSSRNALLAALCLTLVFAGIEFIAGLWANSLALIADAGHMLTDSSALALAALAAWIATRPATNRRTWGHGRAEVLAALINGAVMCVLVGLIVWQAVERFQTPRDVRGSAVIGVALIGLAVNVLVFFVLSRGERNINVRGAMLHVLGDLLGSVAALVSGIVILATGWTPIDPLLSLLICALILFAAARLLMDGVHVVMEGVPGNIDLKDVRTAMTEIDGVAEIHDLHIWQVSSERVALSAHVVVVDLIQWPEILHALNGRLLDRFGIDHPTLQPETVSAEYCRLHPDACRPRGVNKQQ